MRRIDHYESYRTYLKDFYLERKRRQGFSYARFARLAGLRSPNYLKLIIDGKRGLTTAGIQQVADALELGPEERRLFEAVVLRDQSSTPIERRYYSKRVTELKTVKPPVHQLIRRADILARWYYPAITFALHERSVTERLETFVRLIGITPAEMREGVVHLKSRGLLSVASGRYRATYRHFLIDDPRSILIEKRRYAEAQFDRSRRAFRRQYPRRGHWHAYTFTVGKDELARLDNRLSRFIEQLSAEAETRPMSHLAQLNVQFFSLAD